MNLKVKKLHPDAKLPVYANPSDAGMDLFALDRVEVEVGKISRIKTGLAVEIPEGYVGLCWDKSGLAMNHGIKVMAGVIDAGFRGELELAVINLGSKSYVYEKGHKVMQMLIQKVENPEIIEASELSQSERGARGFGSTGR